MTTFYIFFIALICSQPDSSAPASTYGLESTTGPSVDAMASGLKSLGQGALDDAVSHLSKPSPSERYLSLQQYYLGQSLFYSRRYQDAADAFASALKSSPPEWLRERLELRQAESLIASHQFEAALPKLQSLIEVRPTPELLFQLASVLEKLHSASGVQAARRQLLVKYPSHPYAIALKNNTALKLTPAEKIQVARRLLTDGNAQYALAALADLPDKLIPSLESDALLLKLRISLSLDNTALLESIWKKVEKLQATELSDALMLKARYFMKRDDNSTAIETLKRVYAISSSTSNAAEARFLEGWLLLQTNRFEECAGKLKQLAQLLPKSPRTNEAEWYRSLCLISLGRMTDAQMALDKLQQRLPSGPARSQALYWTARTAELDSENHSESPAGYRTQYERLASDRTHGFYSVLARLRLEELGGAVPTPKVKTKAHQAPLSSDFQFASQLAIWGLRLDAEAAFREATRGIRTPNDALKIAAALLSEHHYHPASEIASQWSEFDSLSRNVFVIPNASYPQAYKSLLGDMSEADRRFFWSIMRRESRFSPGAKSFANARGLMQLITPTAQQVAIQLSTKHLDEVDLFNPAVNIPIARWYIDALRKRFTHPGLIAASYNAGPNPVERWMKERGHLPFDLFTELIPFKETRNYVKSVLADYDLYTCLYSPHQGASISLQLPLVVTDGVRF